MSREAAGPLRRIARSVLRPPTISRDRALGASERISALTSLNSSLEYLTQHEDNYPGGWNDWSVVREQYSRAHPFLRKVLDLVADPRATRAVHASRAVVSAALLAPGQQRWRGAASLYLAATSALLSPRHTYGRDGTDQASVVVQSATGAARLVRTEEAKDALVWCAAAQCALSYAASGWVKLLGDQWRDGSALGAVMRTRAYGHRRMWQWTKDHPRAAQLLVYSVLALESAFPLVYAAGGRLTRPMLASAAVFHAVNAYLMGLSRFFTSFVSMHPLVAYTTVPASHPVGARRDDRGVTLAVTLLGAGTAALVYSALRRRAAVLMGPPRARQLTTGAGNRLQYEVHAEGASDEPVVVFECPLAATSEHFAWILRYLERSTGFGLVSYYRAGYGGSHRDCTAPYGLDESASDLVDLVHEVSGDRRVYLVGHSLGGEIARRAAPLLTDRLDGVVYLDASHPGQLTRSPRRMQEGDRLHMLFTHMDRYLRLGTGWLLSAPPELATLPAHVRHRALDHYRDARTWRAARREWRAADSEFRAFTGELPPAPGRALVISARHTIDTSSEILSMHRELGQAHGVSEDPVVVEGADHDGLLAEAPYALEAAWTIAEFAGRRRADGVEREAQA